MIKAVLWDLDGTLPELPADTFDRLLPSV